MQILRRYRAGRWRARHEHARGDASRMNGGNLLRACRDLGDLYLTPHLSSVECCLLVGGAHETQARSSDERRATEAA